VRPDPRAERPALRPAGPRAVPGWLMPFQLRRRFVDVIDAQDAAVRPGNLRAGCWRPRCQP
jgi:hypothetical protein